MPDNRVLVVGTTPDYIEYIFNQAPDRALFLVDHQLVPVVREAGIPSSVTISCALTERDRALHLINDHLNNNDQILSGITGYDCEWLPLAAFLASEFGLPYCSEDSIRLAQDKYRSKLIWSELGLRCPKAELIHEGRQTLGMINRFDGPVVLKPLSGTGSELTFVCHDQYDLSSSFNTIKEGLQQRQDNPLFATHVYPNGNSEISIDVVVEEYIIGREYSADIIIDHEATRIIRTAQKISNHEIVFGTIRAYIVPARLPQGISEENLAKQLGAAARALGISNAICMVDFMITQDEVVLLELTPRIGGDCLPWVIKHCCGLDMIMMAFDYAETGSINLPNRDDWKEMIGLRLFANNTGRLNLIESDALQNDASVRQISFRRAVGDQVNLPPDDYSSRLIGHVIFEPSPDRGIEDQCDEIQSKIKIKVEPFDDTKRARIDPSRIRNSATPHAANR